MSGIIKFFGGQQQAKSERDAAKISALGVKTETIATIKADLFTAGNLDTAAGEEISQGNVDARRRRRKGELEIGVLEAAIGKSGFTTEGFDDLVEDSKHEIDLDELLIRRGGQLRAEALFNQANQLRASAEFTRITGRTREATAIFTGETRARASRLSGTVGLVESIEQAAAAAAGVPSGGNGSTSGGTAGPGGFNPGEFNR